jgi:hypothetical protein
VKKKLIVLTVFSLFFLCFKLVEAERLESDSYVITFGNFNVTSGEKDSTTYHLTDTVGQVGSGPYGEYGTSSYFVGSGFQYIYQINTFSFQISKNLIDFGELTIDTHNTDSHTLTITTQGAGGYSVYAYEEHPLRKLGGSAEIPNTTCDAGGCTYTTAAVWSNQSIPGFGYNMSGNDVPAGFINSTYFKSFADDESAQAMQIVMSSANVAEARQATVTYKAGIDSSQASGNYETAVVFVAVPGF